MPAFRPGGMSDSDNSDDDDFYINYPKPSKNNGHFASAGAQPSKDDIAKIEQAAERRHLYVKALNEILSCSDTFDSVEEALKGGITINEVKDGGWTFLHYACREGKPKTIAYLLGKGADVNHISENDGLPPFIALCSSEKRSNTALMKECLELLVSNGARLTSSLCDRSGCSPLLYAARDNLPEFVDLFLQFGVDINHQDIEGNTALHIAAERGNGKIICKLLQNGAQVDLQNENGQTAYDCATEYKFFQIAEILYRVQTTKWIPGGDPALVQQLRDSDSLTKESPKEQLLRPQREIIDMTLESIGFRDLIPIFKNHKMDFLGFLRVTDEDLQSIGINELGTRQKILDAVRTLHNAEWNKSSVNSFFLQGNITSPEVVCMLDDMKNHMEFMSQTMVFLLNRLKAEPKALISGSDRARPLELARYTEAAILAADGLKTRARELVQFFKLVEDRADLKIGDFVEKKRNRKTKYFISAAAVVVFTAVLLRPTKYNFLRLPSSFVNS